MPGSSPSSLLSIAAKVRTSAGFDRFVAEFSQPAQRLAHHGRWPAHSEKVHEHGFFLQWETVESVQHVARHHVAVRRNQDAQLDQLIDRRGLECVDEQHRLRRGKPQQRLERIARRFLPLSEAERRCDVNQISDLFERRFRFRVADALLQVHAVTLHGLFLRQRRPFWWIQL